MVVSVHIPKSAGTSFKWVLQRIYGERVWFDYGRAFTRDQVRPGLVPYGMRCIHGHFRADAFDDLYPERTLITWVRHPVERVAATYHHFLRTPDMADDCCRALYERRLSLRAFADLEWMRDTATRYLAGLPVEAFAFVGIVERFDDSLRRFVDEFGQGPLAAVPRQNVNRSRAARGYDLSPEDFDYIRQRNETDCRWYEEALQASPRAGAAGVS
jgi:hypothetical protein